MPWKRATNCAIAPRNRWTFIPGAGLVYRIWRGAANGLYPVVPHHGLGQGARVVLDEAPAVAALGEDGPAAVGQATEAFPHLFREAEQVAHAQAEGGAVRGHDQDVIGRHGGGGA